MDGALTALREGLGWTLILVGVALTLLSAVGLHRFTSVFARMQVAGKATTLGILLVLLGTALSAGAVGDALVVLLGAALVIVTAPAGFNAMGRAADRTEDHGRRRTDERTDAPPPADAAAPGGPRPTG
jgi:multicomponent Na+:H+ antiporter subunit G